MAFKLIVFSCLLAFGQAAHLGFGIASSIENRIVGGHDAEVGEFPHQVSLQWGHIYSSTNHFCGGSIISDRWILTAGHCVDDLPGYGVFLVKAGKHNIKIQEANEQISVIEQTIIHDLYTGTVAPYDIALLKLTTPLMLNDFVAPIKLPHANFDVVGTVVLSGWGSVSMTSKPTYPDILQTVELSIIDLMTCNSTIHAIANDVPSPLHVTNICTGPLYGGFSACSADSGGPLITYDNDDNVLVGVVSWGMIPCGMPKAPSVFVKVSAFVDWIEKNIRSNS